MDHDQITRLRRQAATARQDREKAVITPDTLDALLDIACDRLDEDEL